LLTRTASTRPLAWGQARGVRPTEAFAGFCGVYANRDERATVSAGGEGLVVQFVEGDGSSEVSARPIGPKTFEIVGGPYSRDRFDFPLPGFARFGSTLMPQA